MQKSTNSMTHTVGYQGGHNKGTVYWDKKLQLWSYFDDNEGINHYWCAFGTQDPCLSKLLTITCEINPPKEGIDRSVGGAFAKGPDGKIYVTHNGKIGGGRKRVGKTAFWEKYPEDQADYLNWSDGQLTKAVAIASLDSEEIKSRIAKYVHDIDWIKHDIFRGLERSRVQQTKIPPEPKGKTKKYFLSAEVERHETHRTVAIDLHAELKKRGYDVDWDQYSDMYIYDRMGKIIFLFEIKTDSTYQSIYSAIGQLFFHGSSEKPKPKYVAVIPEKPEKYIRKVLNKLDIEILGACRLNGFS